MARLETLREQTGARHQPERGGETRRGCTELVERGDDFEIQRARINLPDRIERRVETEVLDDAGLEGCDFLGVAAEQRELIELRADGALEPAHGIARDEFLDAGERAEKFLPEHRETFAEGGGLGGDVVRAAGEHQAAVRRGLAREREQRGGGFETHDFKRTENLQLLDVFGEITAGEAEVDELAVGEIGELLDAGLHVVQRDAFAPGDGGEVDLMFNALVVLDRGGRNGDAEITLRLHDGDPEIAFEGDAPVLRPDGFHRGRGVALGEDVGDGGICGGGVGGVHG